MDLVGSKTLALPCASVWQALNDPDILIQCLPGCETFKRIDAHAFEVVLTASVGPIKARFTGQLHLSDLDPPHGYTLSFSGSGGAAGMGKGQALVSLAAQDKETVLSYTVKAHVSGRLAQVGSRLIDGVAAKMAEEFFAKFIQVVAPVPLEPAASPAPVSETLAPTQSSLMPWLIGGLVGVVAVLAWVKF